MKKEYYIILRNLLRSLNLFKLVDYDLQQYNQTGEDHVPITPGAYIGFRDIRWQVLLQNVQRSDMIFTITTVTETAYGDERDILDTSNINHLDIERQVYQALMGQRFYLSDVPGYGSLLNTPNDTVLLDNILRSQTQTHKQINNLIITTMPYAAIAYDYSAMPAMQEILADLTIETDITDFQTLYS